MYTNVTETEAPLGRNAPVPKDEEAIVPNEKEVEFTTYYVAIPIAAVAFATIVVILLCMKRRNVPVDERQHPIDPNLPSTRRQETAVRGEQNLAFSPPETPAHATISAGPNSTGMREPMEMTSDSSRRSAPLMPSSNQKLRPVGKAAPIQLPVVQNKPMNISQPINKTDITSTTTRVSNRTTKAIGNEQQYRERPNSVIPSIVSSLDASSVFQRLKYHSNSQRQKLPGTRPKQVKCDVDENVSTRQRLQPMEVQLSKFRTLKTDFNSGMGSLSTSDPPVPQYMKCQTFDFRRRKLNRQSERDREAEMEWAIEHHLTDEKLRSKFTSPRQSQKTKLSRRLRLSSINQPVEDLPKELRQSTESPNSSDSFRRKPRTAVVPKPYKLQAQQSIRPRKNVQRLDSFRRKQPSSVIAKSIKRRSNRFSKDFELNLAQVPTFYTQFDIPTPPPSPPVVEMSTQKENNPAEVQKGPSLPQDSYSIASDHDYAEINDLSQGSCSY